MSNVLDEVLTEKEVMEFLGLKRSLIDRLRQTGGLPFCKVNKTTRYYLASDILDYITSKRIVVNSDG